MKRTMHRVGNSIALAVVLLSAHLCTQAGGSLLLFAPGVPFGYSTAAPVSVFTDLGLLGPLTNAEADALAAAGWASWTSIPTSSFAASVAGEIELAGVPTDIVLANVAMVVGTFNGGGIHVIYDTDGTIMSGFFGTPPGVLGIGSPEFAAPGTSEIVESYVVLNGAGVDPADPAGASFGGVFTHEFGHAVNLAHTQVNGAFFFFGNPTAPEGCAPPWGPGMPPPAAIETMYPFTDVSPGGLGVELASADHLDDKVALSNIYPAPGWPASFGSIAGTVFMPDGVTEATGINVVVRNLAAPFLDALSVLSGEPTQGMSGPDGEYVHNGLTPGASYALFIERINGGGFPTSPMVPFPGPEEFWNAGSESASPVSDPPCALAPIPATAGVTFPASMIVNGIGAASMGTFYGSTGTAGGGTIITIDPATGSGTLVGTTGLGAVQGLAINTLGHVYGTTLSATTGASTLYRLDAVTAAPTPVGPTGAAFLEGIAFDESDVLYGVTFGGTLVTLSTGTGAATAVGSTGLSGWAGLAFDPPTGTLYASMGGFSATPDGIYTISKTTAAPTLLGLTGLGGATPDLLFSAAGMLYGSKGGGGGSNSLISISKTTGAGTVIGSIGFSSVSGLATGISVWVPIQLAYFTGAVEQNGDVLLTWGTISETNNYGFEIQKSPETPAAYQTIPNSFVPGHGTTLEPQHYQYRDVTATAGRWYYRLKQIDFDGTVHYHDGVVVDVLTGVEPQPVPTEFSLQQNYPNPFNPISTISFDIPVESHVRLELFDVLGKSVKIIMNDAIRAGVHTVQVDASDLASGVYLYRLTAGSFRESRKMMVSK